MDAIPDFEDLLELLRYHNARYLIVGGLAFIYHAKPRYTKDMDLWVDPSDSNIEKTNLALAEFGSPTLLDYGNLEQVVQIGLPPNRIDLLVWVGAVTFEEAWTKRIVSEYGGSPANWIDLDSLLAIKSAIDHPRHQEDARVLRQVRALK
ncbi:MAG: hypothetical protein U1E27_11305, partial [Kiritimatiellia bacterium]|nr:hypothetical protein [Kiritimatiellia bacterium]